MTSNFFSAGVGKFLANKVCLFAVLSMQLISAAASASPLCAEAFRRPQLEVLTSFARRSPTVMQCRGTCYFEAAIGAVNDSLDLIQDQSSVPAAHRMQVDRLFLLKRLLLQRIERFLDLHRYEERRLAIEVSFEKVRPGYSGQRRPKPGVNIDDLDQLADQLLEARALADEFANGGHALKYLEGLNGEAVPLRPADLPQYYSIEQNMFSSVERIAKDGMNHRQSQKEILADITQELESKHWGLDGIEPQQWLRSDAVRAQFFSASQFPGMFSEQGLLATIRDLVETNQPNILYLSNRNGIHVVRLFGFEKIGNKISHAIVKNSYGVNVETGTAMERISIRDLRTRLFGISTITIAGQIQRN